jgi:energy-coupling factor transporter transmembrane protein EcfT
LYDVVVALNFFRPVYLQILTVLLTLLIVLAASYGVLLRPFTQIVPTVGALVLGVWGVRSLLVGAYPPDSTGVDLGLEGAILLLLFTVASRAALFMLPRAHLGRG